VNITVALTFNERDAVSLLNWLARCNARLLRERPRLPLLYRTPLVPAATRRARSRDALTRVGLASRLDHHPSQLSGGQQQRIAIARALVTQPDLILADEPTGNLDTRTSIEIMALFQELNDAGITLVMVTHEPDIAAFCRRILVMRDGRVVSDTQPTQRRIARDELASPAHSGETEPTETTHIFPQMSLYVQSLYTKSAYNISSLVTTIPLGRIVAAMKSCCNSSDTNSTLMLFPFLRLSALGWS
jgi:ABC-type methionine transport system ATPase subunit